MHWFEIVIELTTGVSLEDAYAVIYANGSTGCSEEGDVVKAYFGAGTDTGRVARELEKSGCRAVSVSRIEDADWSAGWKETIGPYLAGGFLICPPWKVDECVPAEGETRIIIDPGEAFGEGGHPTTKSVLALMRKWAKGRGELSGASFLDVGTGTGILSVAAAALGFGGIRAVDIEPKAVMTAGANFALNGIAGKVELGNGGIETVSGSYDLIAANVFLGPLLTIIPKAVELLRPDGVLIVSGVLPDQFGRIVECARSAGLDLSERLEPEGWVSGLFVSAGRAGLR